MADKPSVGPSKFSPQLKNMLVSKLLWKKPSLSQAARNGNMEPSKLLGKVLHCLEIASWTEKEVAGERISEIKAAIEWLAELKDRIIRGEYVSKNPDRMGNLMDLANEKKKEFVISEWIEEAKAKISNTDKNKNFQEVPFWSEEEPDAMTIQVDSDEQNASEIPEVDGSTMEVVREEQVVTEIPDKERIAAIERKILGIELEFLQERADAEERPWQTKVDEFEKRLHQLEEKNNETTAAQMVERETKHFCHQEFKKFTEEVQSNISDLVKEMFDDDVSTSILRDRTNRTENELKRVIEMVKHLEAELAKRELTGRNQPIRYMKSEEEEVIENFSRIPIFKGNPAEYMVFRQRITVFAEKYPNVDSYVKYKALVNQLDEEHQRLLSEYASHPTGSYEAAVDRLDRKYQRVKPVEIMIEKIIEIGKIDLKSIEKMQNLEEFLRSATKLYGGEKVRYVTPTVMTLFDDAVKREWRKKTATSLSGSDTVPEKELIEFLVEQRRQAELMNNYSTKSETPVREPKSESTKRWDDGKTNQNLGCMYCKGDHSLRDCKTFDNDDKKTRSEKMKQNGHCLNCLKYGHEMTRCRVDGCKGCKKKLHTLLHDCGKNATWMLSSIGSSKKTHLVNSSVYRG